MLTEYFSIRNDSAEPGKGLLHSTSDYNDAKRALDHFKKAYPGHKIVAYKHQIKKSSMGPSFVKKPLYGQEVKEENTVENKKSPRPDFDANWTRPNTTKKYIDAIKDSMKLAAELKRKKEEKEMNEGWDGQVGAHVMAGDGEVIRRATKADIGKKHLTIHHVDQYGESTHKWDHESQKFKPMRSRGTFHDTNEETISEVSKGKLEKYLDRANGDFTHQYMGSQYASTPEQRKEFARKRALRQKGISRAVDKLYPQNEDTINEVSLKLAANTYGKRASQAVETDDYSTGPEDDAEMHKLNKKSDKTWDRIHKRWGKRGTNAAEKAFSKHHFGEEVALEEGKMSEIHADISDHMDKHIKNYKRLGGAEALMGHADTAAKNIAKMHNIAHPHAKKFVSDYIEGRLNESEQLDEVFPAIAGMAVRGALSMARNFMAKRAASTAASVIKPNPARMATTIKPNPARSTGDSLSKAVADYGKGRVVPQGTSMTGGAVTAAVGGASTVAGINALTKKPEAPDTSNIKPITVAAKSFSKPEGKSYDIQQGDTLSGIAAKHKTSVDALMKANPHIKDPDKIYAGKSLKLEGLEEGYKVGDRVAFTKDTYWGPRTEKGTIIHDHGDGRYNINTNRVGDKTKKYPSTVHKSKIIGELGEDTLIEGHVAIPGNQHWETAVNRLKTNSSKREYTRGHLYDRNYNLYNSHQEIPQRHFHQAMKEAGIEMHSNFEKDMLKAKTKGISKQLKQDSSLKRLPVVEWRDQVNESMQTWHEGKKRQLQSALAKTQDEKKKQALKDRIEYHDLMLNKYFKNSQKD